MVVVAAGGGGCSSDGIAQLVRQRVQVLGGELWGKVEVVRLAIAAMAVEAAAAAATLQWTQNRSSCSRGSRRHNATIEGGVASMVVVKRARSGKSKTQLVCLVSSW